MSSNQISVNTRLLEHRKTGILLNTVLLIAVTVYFFILNQAMLTYADDHCRTYENFSVWNAARGAWKDYMLWSGRLPALFLNRLFLSASSTGILIFNLINSAFLLLLIFQVRRLLDTSWRSSTTAIALLPFLFLAWFVPEVFGETVLWKSGAMQYFWNAVLVLVLLNPLLSEVIYRRKLKWNKTGVIAYCLLALICGGWLEHVSVAVVFIWTTLLIYYRFGSHQKPDTALVLGLVFFTIGTAILIAAPGNYIRADVLSNSNLPLHVKLFPLADRIIDVIDRKLLVLAILFLVARITKPDASNAARLSLALVFTTLAILCAMASLGAPGILFNTGHRIAFHFEFFLIMATVCLVPDYYFRTGFKLLWSIRVIATTAILSILVVLIVDARNVLNVYQEIGNQHRQRIMLINEARAANSDLLTLPALSFGPHTGTGANREINKGRLFARDITNDPGHWLNRCYSRVYKLGKVVID